MMHEPRTSHRTRSLIGKQRTSQPRWRFPLLSTVLLVALSMGWVPLVQGANPITVLVDQDSWLKEAAPNDNFGEDKELPIKHKPTDNERAVFRFDLTPIPEGAEILQATATFRVTTPDSQPVNVYRLTKDWEEQTVTWNTIGTDFDPTTIYGPFTPAQDDAFVSVDLTTLVQDWVCGTPNDGIIFIPTSDDEQSKYYSKEEDQAAYRSRVCEN